MAARKRSTHMAGRKKAVKKTTKKAPAKKKAKKAKKAPARRKPKRDIAATSADNKAGRPLFEPTPEQRQQVELMHGMGLTLKEIATLTLNPETGKGISVNTLRDRFKDELASGHAKIKLKTFNSIYQKAWSKGPGAVTAAIFLLKTRYGLTERIRVDGNLGAGVLVAPAGMTPEQFTEMADKLNLNSTPPGKDDRSGD